MAQVKILAVNDSREIPTKSGGKFRIQDAECVVTEEDGSITVGALSLPRDMVDKGLVSGDYIGRFKWVRDYKNGRLVNELQGLTPAPLVRPVAAAPAAAK